MVSLLTSPLVVLIVVIPLFLLAAAQHLLRPAQRQGWQPRREVFP
ncbi:hypothetical protein [Streptomyces katrae]|nr:hypothetical protein [Streptomyces katrae]